MLHFRPFYDYYLSVRKISTSLFLFIFLLTNLYSFSIPQKALADQNCQVTTNPSPITTDMKFIDLYITSPTSVFKTRQYKIKINDRIVTAQVRPSDLPAGWITFIPNLFMNWLTDNPGAKTYTPNAQQIDVIKVNPNGLTVNDYFYYDWFNKVSEQFPVFNVRYEKKLYLVSVLPAEGGDPICTAPFGGQQTCTISWLNNYWDNREDILFKITDESNNMSSGNHRILVQRGTNSIGTNQISDKGTCKDLSELKNSVSIGNNLNIGNYTLEVRDSCNEPAGQFEEKACSAGFTICTPGSTGAGCGPSASTGAVFQWAVQPAAPKIDICAPGTTNGKTNFTCNTALNKIETEPTRLIGKLFGILLSLSGGIALLLIIYSGYQLMMAQGNPEKIQGAKETLTSAIVGLLFIIFSVVILQIIGVEILRIPGFGK